MKEKNTVVVCNPINAKAPIESYAKLLEAIRELGKGNEGAALEAMLRISQEMVQKCIMCDNFCEGYYCNNCQNMFDDLATELREN